MMEQVNNTKSVDPSVFFWFCLHYRFFLAFLGVNFKDLVLMFLSDAGSPMIKLGTELKNKGFNKLIYILCTAHAMHNVAGTIRKHYAHVDNIVMNFKAILV